MTYSFAERTYLKTATAVMGRSMVVSKPREFYALHRVTVTAVEDVAPKLRRLTLQGDSLRDYRRVGVDEYFGLVMPPRGQELQLPEGRKLSIRSELQAMPEQVRPACRWYTVRHHRPEAGEVDVDIVVHDQGPGGEFLARVQPGMAVGFREGTGGWQVPEGRSRQWWVADETALPAVGAMIEALREAGVGTGDIRLLAEVPDPDYAAPLDPDVAVEWIYRADAVPGSALLPRLPELAPEAVDFAWCCGEQKLAAEARRHFVKALGMPKPHVLFSGYWRVGRARE